MPHGPDSHPKLTTLTPPLETNDASGRAGAGAIEVPTPQNAGADPSPSDGIELLKADHRRVEGMFEAFEQAAAGRKSRIVRQICRELVIHTTLEEEIFYRACREAASDEDPLDEAQVEHDSAKMLIADLMRAGRADRYRDAKVSVLAELIRHHVAEEEKPSDGIFARAQAAGVNTPDLAQRLQTRKRALQVKPNELPTPQPVSFQISTSPEAPQEDQMARQGDNNRDDRGRFTSDEERGGGGRSRRDYEDRSYRSRARDDDDGRGWHGDPQGHAEAARRGWAERSGESRSFSRSRDDDDDRGGRNGDRDRDDRGRFMSDEDDRGYRARGRDDDDDRRGDRSGGGDRDRDERGRFASDDDDRGYRARGRDDDDRRGDRSGGGDRDRDERGRFASDDRGYRARSRDDDDRRGGRSGGGDRDRDERGRFASADDDRGSRARSRDDDDRGGRGQGGWFGDSRGHAEAARRGWEERDSGGSRSRSRNEDDERGSRSRSSRDDDRGDSGGRSQGGWFGDSQGHAQAARRGWDDRR
jgi:hypothetical protein